MNNKYSSKTITCLICITIISFTWCFGQNNKSDNKFAWVNLGFGGSSGGFSVGINGSYQFRYHIISLRTLYNAEWSLTSTPDESGDIGLLYGLSSKKKKTFVSISTGISRVVGSINTHSKEMDYVTLGIPIELQLFLTGKQFGIGIYGFANINRESSFVGALFCIQLGKLRESK